MRDEVAYREGLELGLDRDDPLIRRRVRQKVDVLAEESMPREPPTDAELGAWLAANPARYAQPPVLSFEQAMVDAQRPAGQVDAALARARSRLEAGESAAVVSDARLLPTEVRDMPADLVARQFGEEFAAALVKLSTGSWQGPVRSAYGLHVVKLTARTEGRIPPLDAVRVAVARDMEADRRAKATEAFYADLRRKFDIRIEADLSRSWPTK